MTKIRADRRVGLLLAGVILLTFVAIGATIALPATDKSLRTKPVAAKAYAGTSPDLLSLERTGGDLTRLKTRFPDGASLIASLKAPAKGGRQTSMSSYSYLSPSDLEALASYLLSSR